MLRAITLGALAALGLAAVGVPAAPDAPPAKPRKPHGIEARVPWTSSRVVGTPDPPSPYRMENAFPKLAFDAPLDLAAVPGTDRLAVALHRGKLFTFPNRRDATEKHPLIDVKSGVYGLAFHPKFAE